MSKRKRDPDAPKRALSAYFCFTADVRAETKAELGDDAKITDIAKAMGAKWKKMSDKQKAPYQKKADKDKKRYAKEKAKYDKSGKAEKWAAANPPTSGKKKRKKDPNAPKRALSAYFCFTADVRAEVKAGLGDGAGVTDVAKALGAKWKTLSDKQKAPYVKKADKDKQRYAKEMAKYNKSK